MGLISNGTTIFDNGAMASGFVGSMTFISSQTASASASISFTTGIDSTYKEYQFYFVNLHASAISTFSFQTSTDGGSNYGVTTTTTYFNAGHNEADNDAFLSYNTGRDLAQSTSFQQIAQQTNTGNDDNVSGVLKLFNPASTTYVKHFINRVSNSDSVYAWDINVAGYFNTTSAINAVQFKFSTGNIDAGKILLFGIN
jgi:hypothetical protein